MQRPGYPAPPSRSNAMDDGHDLVAAVRSAAQAHSLTWEAMVPDQFTVNLGAEAAEEAAYAEMARRKRALRDHICDTYGISIRELTSLALP
jgi:hypothetical protein